jgi:hypothetical protein
VEVEGAVELAGNLIVSLADLGDGLFAPRIGDRFEVIAANGAVTGEFADAELPPLPDELDWFVDYQPSSVTLAVLAAADFDRDGDVDGTDLASWQSGVGAIEPEKQNGDANDDGFVDGADFLMWQRQVGAASQLAANTLRTPEPGSCVMALLATVCYWLRAAPFMRRR